MYTQRAPRAEILHANASCLLCRLSVYCRWFSIGQNRRHSGYLWSEGCKEHCFHIFAYFTHSPSLQELSNPPVESGDCGYLVCNVDLPPLCSPYITSGPPSPLAQSLTQSLQDTLIGCDNAVETTCLDHNRMALCVYSESSITVTRPLLYAAASALI